MAIPKITSTTVLPKSMKMKARPKRIFNFYVPNTCEKTSNGKTLNGAGAVAGGCGGMGAGFIAGAAIGSVVPVVGTLLGAMAGTLWGAGIGAAVGACTPKRGI